MATDSVTRQGPTIITLADGTEYEWGSNYRRRVERHQRQATLYERGLQLQGTVNDLTTLATRDLTRLFDRYGDRDVFGELARRGVPELIRPYLDGAAVVSARWYDALAAGEGVAYRAEPMYDIPAERIDKSVDWAMNAPGDATPLDRLAGSTSRMIADASRQTVIGNAAAEGIRWARVAAPGACTFCAMLATRGPVYHSEADALASHDHCKCLAVPVRRPSLWQPPAYVDRWTDEYYAARAAVGEANADTRTIQAKMREQRKAQDAEAAEAARIDAEFATAAAVDYWATFDPAAELAGAFGGDETPPAEAPASEAPPAELSALDRKLAEANAAMEAGEFDRADQLFAQAEKLEARAQAAEARAEAKAAEKAAAEQAKQDKVLDLIEQGWDPAEAQAEAFGVSVERVRRDEFIAEARRDGHEGRGFDELLRSVHAEKAAEQYWAAEAATNGYMLKRKFDGKIDPRKLWTVNEATARKWMSDEMAEWFDQNGRITRAGLRAAVLDGRGSWRSALTEDFLQ
ncbi:head maturation protease [Mycobacterium phage DS6A]|uniref:Capsid maturation protease n=1 Tax=Mycobacterium phage DS6A TaxID=45764 RepID=G8I4B7_9CAUD|nr:head maturation protease [Mycobacterium phage DS6A]AER47561.1 hypothetical protein DS6A_7 [Mycobacterium phage DS6A]